MEAMPATYGRRSRRYVRSAAIISAMLVASSFYWWGPGTHPTLAKKGLLGKDTFGFVSGLAFSPDGRALASGGERLIVWDTPSGRSQTLRVPVPHTGVGEGLPRAEDDDGMLTITLAFSPDGGQLATGDHAGLLRIWDVASGQLLAELDGHRERRVLAVAFSPGGETLASVGDDRAIKLWDATDRWRALTLEEAGQGGRGPMLPRPSSYVLGFRPDGQTLVSAELQGSTSFRLWDVERGSVKTIRDGLENLWPHRLSPDARRLLAGDERGEALWDIDTGKSGIFLEKPREGAWGNSGSAFSPDGSRVAVSWVAHSRPKRARASDPDQSGSDPADYAPELRTDVAIHSAVTGRLLALLEGQSHAAYSPDGKTLATVGGQGSIILWDAGGLPETR